MLQEATECRGLHPHKEYNSSDAQNSNTLFWRGTMTSNTITVQFK